MPPDLYLLLSLSFLLIFFFSPIVCVRIWIHLNLINTLANISFNSQSLIFEPFKIM